MRKYARGLLIGAVSQCSSSFLLLKHFVTAKLPNYKDRDNFYHEKCCRSSQEFSEEYLMTPRKPETVVPNLLYTSKFVLSSKCEDRHSSRSSHFH